MSNIKLILEYDGTGFSGWQKQPGAGLRTVQGVLEEALERLTGISHVTVGAGRTDAGVHALGQVAHFYHGVRVPVRALAGSPERAVAAGCVRQERRGGG